MPVESTHDSEFGVSYGNILTAALNAGVPVLAVAGTHTGCIEVWARPGINIIADLRGKTIAVNTKTFTAAGKPVASVQYGFLVS